MPAAPALRETQRQFLAALYDAAAAGPLALIAGNGLEPEARLRIYRHSCEEIQTATLRTVYPAVQALVGEAFFDQTTRAYRRTHPSVSGNLQTFGAAFADYLAGVAACDALAYLPDVARLEWLRQESALARDTDPLPPDEMARLVQDGAGSPCIGVHPSVRLLASAYPVMTIWRYAMQPDGARLQLPDGGESVVLWRDAAQVAMATLDSASFAWLDALAHDATPDAAIAAAHVGDTEFDPAGCLQSFADHGLLVARATSDFSEE